MTVRVNKTQRHPGTAHLLGLLDTAHLPAHLREISGPIEDLDHKVTAKLTDGPELTAGLRKLLEAKDCLVRQAVLDAKSQAEQATSEAEQPPDTSWVQTYTGLGGGR